jgi:hypothetical protein
VESEVPTEHSFGLVHDSLPVRDAKFGQLRKNAPRSVMRASVWGARNERQIAPSTHVLGKKVASTDLLRLARFASLFTGSERVLEANSARWREKQNVK